jgi:small subunit ribosomal protein S21|tara:strand:+ start:497 stop:688 length:192 start_codon:yes stop_codon:yes gene_type:complete
LVSVKLKPDEPFERALRRFKKKWEKAGILKDVKSKAFYLKPSEQKKLAKAKVPIWKKKKIANR